MRPLRTLLGTLASGALAVGLLAPLPAEAAPARRIAYSSWEGADGLAAGRMAGVKVGRGVLKVTKDATGRRVHAGRGYTTGTWTSPWVRPAFDLTQLIASWEARTPGDSWIEVSVRGRTPAGKRSSWDVLGRWASGDQHLRRTSVGGQGDDLADVNVDTWATSTPLDKWQVRVTLLKGAGSKGPRVAAIGAMASVLPSVSDVATSQPGPGSGIVLDVPRYSQMTHSGHYPQWGNGGQAWCSPTSTSMVLGYYDALPRPRAYRWVDGDHPDPWVDHAARMTYDHDYRGTGNWPFNTAYAAPLVEQAFVTRLRSLREAGLFIEAGIPLVASISFGSGDLDNSPISGTNGHLLVIVGFTASGDVVVNDPAAKSRKGVRRVYDRGQFEDAWLPTSGGLVYVIRDAAHPLPEGNHSNW